MLYIVTPQFNRMNDFQRYIDQMKNQIFQDFLLIVVDHGTNDIVCDDNKVVVIKGSSDGWYSYAVNFGIKHILDNLNPSDDDHILLINSDIIISNEYLEQVNATIEKHPNAVIGSCCYDINSNKILYVNMKLNKLHARFDYLNRDKKLSDLQGNIYDSDVLKGLGIVWPVKVIKSIGLYDEIKLPHYKGDHELAWRAKRRGYEVIASGDMMVGALLNSPNRIDPKLSFTENYKRRYIEMRSTNRTKDLFNYSFLSFGKLYATYFFLFNWAQDKVYFVYKYFSLKRENK